jgi:hypothetical protein
MTGGNRQSIILGCGASGFLAAFAHLVEKHGISPVAGRNSGRLEGSDNHFHESSSVTSSADTRSSKAPQVTLVFWIIKIAATTFCKTGGDALSMTLDLGYAVSTGIFFVIFAGAVAAPGRSTRFSTGR